MIPNAVASLHRLLNIGLIIDILKNKLDDLLVLNAFSDVTEVDQLSVSVDICLLIFEFKYFHAVNQNILLKVFVPFWDLIAVDSASELILLFEYFWVVLFVHLFDSMVD